MFRLSSFYTVDCSGAKQRNAATSALKFEGLLTLLAEDLNYGVQHSSHDVLGIHSSAHVVKVLYSANNLVSVSDESRTIRKFCIMARFHHYVAVLPFSNSVVVKRNP